MCGIWLQIVAGDGDSAGDKPPQWLLNRGPDYCRIDVVTPSVRLGASVLHVQGDSLTRQPVHDSAGNILAFNGEIFQHDPERNGISTKSSDTEMLSKVFSDFSSPADAIPYLETTRGPFAFVFYHKASKSIWFGRDLFGRRSLVMRRSDSALEIASVCTNDEPDWKEVPCTGIFSLSIREAFSPDSLQRHSWSHLTGDQHDEFTDPPLPSTVGSYDGSECVSELYRLLSAAMARRIRCLGNHHRDDPTGARVGLLFSGGLDCSVLAALAHEYVPIEEPIDLLNFAFGTQPMLVPDRQTAINSVLELERRFPDRRWRLIEINIELDQLSRHAEHIFDLIKPNVTVMDFNLGSVLWFSGRGQGRVLRDSSCRRPIVSQHCRYSGADYNDSTDIESYYDGTELWDPYQSKCRLLLSGLGADELFGGYARHRTAYKRGGWECAKDELELDLRRLYRRNMGRDDRLLSDSGRDTLYCYLDRDVRGFVRSLPLNKVSRLDLPASAGGDKLLLRQLAAHLGLQGLAQLQKRAIQFGTRIANKSISGTEILSRNTLQNELDVIVRSKPL